MLPLQLLQGLNGWCHGMASFGLAPPDWKGSYLLCCAVPRISLLGQHVRAQALLLCPNTSNAGAQLLQDTMSLHASVDSVRA
jgi:hypothetical protein